MMTDTEAQAHELVLKKEWLKALELFDKFLKNAPIKKSNSRERIVACLLGRSECCLELGRHEAVVTDCRRIIKLLADGNEINTGVRARKRLVHALFSLRRFSEAEIATREWLLTGAHNNPEAVKIQERLRSILQMASGQKGGNVRMLQQKLEEELLALESRFEVLTGQNKDNQYTRNNVEQNNKSDKTMRNDELDSSTTDFVSCSYCGLTFSDRVELRIHCQSDSHQTVIMSDEGRDWKWRPPPRGFKADTYTLCESFSDGATCRYGAQCVEAHGTEELTEWRERFEYRRMKLQRACEKELYGKSYIEQLLEKWIQSASPDKIMKEKLDYVEDSCSAELVTSVSSKTSKREWVFTLKTRKSLQAVALLQDAHRNHFVLKQIILGTSANQKKGKISKPNEAELSSDQEWCDTNLSNSEDSGGTLEHRVKVSFQTDIYGTFRQSVVFDLGLEPVLVKHLCVDVIPVTDADKVKEIKKELVLSTGERWNPENSEIIEFTSPISPAVMETALIVGEQDLLTLYPAPRTETFTLTNTTINEKKLTKNNYRARMHELLFVEEMARYEQVARYNLTTKLKITHKYLLAPNGIATSTAKYSHSGELFALMTLGKNVSEDTSAGRLVLNNCTTILLAAPENKHKSVEKRKVYEALIEDKGKNMIYLRLSAATVKDLNLKQDTDFLCDIQFQLNRISYCEWHYAIDKIADFRAIFPETYLEPSIPWTPQRQWSDMLDSKLNLKQKEAVVAITTPVSYPLPPILIIGPFGTGKTYTLAQAIKQLLAQPDTKILICTHSNSAADLYIKDYLHPYVEAGHEEARPLRIYYNKRWVSTVNKIVQKYCLIETYGRVRSFRTPTVEDILKHRIVVVTLSISLYLSTIGLPKGHFTHILLDEAAQAMECEAIMPLALANDNTRIVLAGDHMQLSPELFSDFAKERNLHVSLLERLYDHYPTTFPCKILLCENYRAHEAIIQFTSELFYDQKLVASGKQPRHERFYPLTFFTTRGEDVQDQSSTAFYNNSEVYEVVERVSELQKKWPTAWGKMDDSSIGIMTPYADQVFRIRSELRKRRMAGISVERVLNVQGKQFRAIFLSTVRTRRTCTGNKTTEDEMNYGFLSNSKLLNTAITRAQSLVAVVGDPVALCSIGRCRKVWERFIDICNTNKSLFGITWALLRSQLDGVELKKTYVLNPLAPEFVPRQFKAEAYIKVPMNHYNQIPMSQQSATLNIPTGSGAVRFPLNVSSGANMTSQFLVTSPITSAGGNTMMPSAWGYFPAQPGPSFPIRYPIVPPQIQFPNTNNQINQWTLNFPVVSPTVGTNTPNNWQTKSVPQIKKPVPVPNNNLEVRGSNPLNSLRSPGGLPVPNSYNQIKNSPVFNQLMNSRTDINNSPINLPTDNYVPGDVFGNNYTRNANQTSQKPAQLLPASNKLPEPPFQAVRKETEKDQIQFLNNVHFPERIPTIPFMGSPATNLLINNPDLELISLLPQHVTLTDMLLQPPIKHVEWYRHLIDVAGIETANRFMDLLMQAKKQHESYQQQNKPNKPVPEIVMPERNLFLQTQQNSLNSSIQQLTWPQEKPLDLNSVNQLPIAPNYMNQKPVMPPLQPLPNREIDSLSLISLNNLQGNATNTHFLNNVTISQLQNRFNAENVHLWQYPPAQQSVPLYRRQGQLTQVSQEPGLLDALEKQEHYKLMQQQQPLQQIQLQNAQHLQQAQSLAQPPQLQPTQQIQLQQPQKPISSNAFAGYARAALSIPTSSDDCRSFVSNGAIQQPLQQPVQQPIQQPVVYNNGYMEQLVHQNQQQLLQQINADFANLSTNDNESMEELLNRQKETTYASVLRTSAANNKPAEEKNGDPFAVLRELGQKAANQNNDLFANKIKNNLENATLPDIDVSKWDMSFSNK